MQAHRGAREARSSCVPATTTAATTATMDEFVENTKALWVPSSIARVHRPSTVEFLRNYVATNTPCIITGLMDTWPAMRKWDSAFLARASGDTQVTVDVTPGGHGDCVLRTGADAGDERWFVKPEEREMTLAQFLDIAADESFDGVAYLSHQNDSLRQEFPGLASDVPEALPLGAEAFGNAPDAVNLWIGDERAVSAVHKDHYENL